MAASTSKPLMMRLLAASVSVSNRAAAIIRDIMKTGDLGIVQKGKNDFQTEADRTAQRCIVTSLHRHFPRISILGEERLEPVDNIPDHLIDREMSAEVLTKSCPSDLLHIKDEDIVVWVDPVDGTSEYTQGLLDHVTVLIGIAVRGQATAGVINQPYYNYQAGPQAVLGRCVWGLVGLGGFGFEQQQPPVSQNIITTTRTHTNQTVMRAIEACRPTQVMPVGGAGHKVLMLLEGKAHAYIYASKGLKKWDTCAPEAVLQAAGGQLTDLLGRPIPYGSHVNHANTSGTLATASNHDWYVSHIPRDIKEMFASGTQENFPRSSL